MNKQAYEKIAKITPKLVWRTPRTVIITPTALNVPGTLSSPGVKLMDDFTSRSRNPRWFVASAKPKGQTSEPDKQGDNKHEKRLHCA